MDFSNAERAKLREAIKSRRFCQKRYVESYLERCQAETARNPRTALELLIAAPDYVHRCRRSLGARYSDYLVRAYAVAGTGLGLCGSFSLAMSSFQNGCSVAGANPIEYAGLKVRRALIEIEREDFHLARSLLDSALPLLKDQQYEIRDDLSHAYALTARGIVNGYSLYVGDDSAPDLESVFGDFEDALRIAHPKCKRTRDAAMTGICTAAATSWLSGAFTQITPLEVVSMTNDFRKHLREEGVPFASILDCKARWVLSLATFRLLGGMSRGTERRFRDARDTLTVVGTGKDVVDITLDFQWCLLADSRWSAALSECAILKDALGEDAVILMWADALKARLIPTEILRKVYREKRGIRCVAHPVVEEAYGEPIGF